MKEMISLVNIQFRIDSDRKNALMRDAMKLDLSMSVIVRRLVEIYLEDPALRKRVVNYNLQQKWESEFWDGKFSFRGKGNDDRPSDVVTGGAGG